MKKSLFYTVLSVFMCHKLVICRYKKVTIKIIIIAFIFVLKRENRRRSFSVFRDFPCHLVSSVRWLILLTLGGVCDIINYVSVCVFYMFFQEEKKMLFNKNSKRSLSPEKGIFSSAISCYLFPLIVFGGYLLYCILAKLMPHAQGYYLIHYLYTYDHGYISRGLVGEVISWFADTVSDDLTRRVMTGFSALLMLGMSLCIGKALSKVRFDKEKLSIVLFIVIMIFMIPMPYKFYYEDIKLDKLVWALTLFAVYIADTKIGKWVVPVICAVATVVNPVFVFTSMVLIAIILLQEFRSSGFSAKNGVICAVTYISIIALALLAPISEKWVGFENAAEMTDYYFARYEGELSNEIKEMFDLWLMDYFGEVKNLLPKSFEIFFIGFGMGIKTAINILFIAIPIYCFTGIFWKKVIKAEENKFQKFIYFLCAITPVVMIPAVILSWEFSKLFINNIFVQAGLIIYFIVKDHSAVIKVCREIRDWGKKYLVLSIVILVYFVCILATIFI